MGAALRVEVLDEVFEFFEGAVLVGQFEGVFDLRGAVQHALAAACHELMAADRPLPVAVAPAGGLEGGEVHILRAKVAGVLLLGRIKPRPLLFFAGDQTVSNSQDMPLELDQSNLVDKNVHRESS